MNLEAFAHYKVGIEIIDEEHWEILRLVDSIKVCAQDKNYDKALALFEKLPCMLKAHYSSEEEMMERIQFPYREYHKTLHATILIEIVKVRHFFLEKNSHMEEHYMILFYQLIVGHLDTADREYIKYYLQWEKSLTVTN